LKLICRDAARNKNTNTYYIHLYIYIYIYKDKEIRIEAKQKGSYSNMMRVLVLSNEENNKMQLYNI